MKIIVSKNGPYIVTGGIPFITSRILHDEEGYSKNGKKLEDIPCRRSMLCAVAVIPKTNHSMTEHI